MHLQVQVWQCKVIILAPRAEKNTANLWMHYDLMTKPAVNVTNDRTVLIFVARCRLGEGSQTYCPTLH
jgi:hypothetical protein